MTASRLLAEKAEKKKTSDEKTKDKKRRMHSGKPYGDGKEGLFLNKITVICPLDEGQTLSERMEHVLNYALHWGSREVERITKASELQSL